jgi:hypothetical protein
VSSAALNTELCVPHHPELTASNAASRLLRSSRLQCRLQHWRLLHCCNGMPRCWVDPGPAQHVQLLKLRDGYQLRLRGCTSHVSLQPVLGRCASWSSALRPLHALTVLHCQLHCQLLLTPLTPPQPMVPQQLLQLLVRNRNSSNPPARDPCSK